MPISCDIQTHTRDTIAFIYRITRVSPTVASITSLDSLLTFDSSLELKFILQNLENNSSSYFPDLIVFPTKTNDVKNVKNFDNILVAISAENLILSYLKTHSKRIFSPLGWSPTISFVQLKLDYPH